MSGEERNRIMRKNKGFTLVELLVVISVIAMLLAILIPTMRKAQEQARFIICKSNFQTYGLAIAMYLQSNKDSFPHPLYCLYSRNTFTDPAYKAACRWHDDGVTPDGPLWPYIRNKNVSFCPTFARIARTIGQYHRDHIPQPSPPIPINPQFTYSVNGFLGSGLDAGEDLCLRNGPLQMPKITDVKRPSEVMFLTEENFWTMNTLAERMSPYINRQVINNGIPLDLSYYGLNDMYFWPTWDGVGTGREGDCIATFHKATDSRFLTGVSSVLFNDGHVGAEKAYDATTAAGTVRRSWQLGTGKSN